MTDAPLALAFTAGLFAAINPCGFAMLPAYLSYYLGREDVAPDARSSIFRAAEVALTTSLGFVAVFAVVGIGVKAFSLSFEPWLPWITSLVGVGLVAVGVLMVSGRQVSAPVPKVARVREGTSWLSMFLFGVSYAVASLSCTLGVFLATVSATFTRSGITSGVAVFLAYAVGMSVVLVALTLALALARQSMVRAIRRTLPYVSRVAGGLLILAGAWFVYYGWYERQDVTRPTWTHWLATSATSANDRLREWVDAVGPTRIGLLLGGAVLAAIILAFGLRRSAPKDLTVGRREGRR